MMIRSMTTSMARLPRVAPRTNMIPSSMILPHGRPGGVQASSGFVSAQVSMVARIASSLYEVTRTCSRLKET